MKINVSTNAAKDKTTYMCWGDWPVKLHLEKAFRDLGAETVKDFHGACDFLFELWGDPVNMVKEYKKNACWFYSHPENMSKDIANGYDWIFCLSRKWLSKFEDWGITNVSFLPSCGHSVPPADRSIIHDIVFVGNTKVKNSKCGRWIMDDLDPLENGFDLSVYGLRWDKYPVMRKFHKGEYWDNLKLNELYGRAKISLADCHRSMMEEDFVPIRVFDIVGSGGFCISNYLADIEYYFEDAVVMYKEPGELVDLVMFYLTHEKERRKKIEKGLKLVKGHTYPARAKVVYEKALELMR